MSRSPATFDGRVSNAASRRGIRRALTLLDLLDRMPSSDLPEEFQPERERLELVADQDELPLPSR